MNNQENRAHWALKQHNQNAAYSPVVVEEQQNDIAAVVSAYDLSHIHYVDISRQRSLNQALSRWPLLAELYGHSQTNAGETA